MYCKIVKDNYRDNKLLVTADWVQSMPKLLCPWVFGGDAV